MDFKVQNPVGPWFATSTQTVRSSCRRWRICAASMPVLTQRTLLAPDWNRSPHQTASHTDHTDESLINPPACRRVLGSCLFVVVLCFVFVLSRLPPWRGFLPRLTWTHPPSPHPFRLHLSLRCGGLNSAHASLNTGLVLHILLSFRWLFLFFCCVCHRFAPSFLYPIVDPVAFVLNTF